MRQAVFGPELVFFVDPFKNVKRHEHDRVVQAVNDILNEKTVPKPHHHEVEKQADIGDQVAIFHPFKMTPLSLL